MELRAHPFSVALPPRWEGAIRASTVDADTRRRAHARGDVLSTPPALHLASVPLPRDRGDFGSGAVEELTSTDAFVAVVEYGRESAGTALFEPGALPRRLRPRDFRGDTLQRALPGQGGLQVFRTERGRALCLYVVLGSLANAAALVDEVNDVLSTLEIAAA